MSMLNDTNNAYILGCYCRFYSSEAMDDRIAALITCFKAESLKNPLLPINLYLIPNFENSHLCISFPK